MAVTPNGLRYPGPADLLADTPVHINNLAADVQSRLAQVKYVVKPSVQISCDASGFFNIPITDFLTLRGVVFLYLANPSDVWTMMPLINGIASQAVSGQMWYMDREGGGYANHAFNGSLIGALMAWGDPR
jgi:hypothetical protein